MYATWRGGMGEPSTIRWTEETPRFSGDKSNRRDDSAHSDILTVVTPSAIYRINLPLAVVLYKFIVVWLLLKLQNAFYRHSFGMIIKKNDSSPNSDIVHLGGLSLCGSSWRSSRPGCYLFITLHINPAGIIGTHSRCRDPDTAWRRF